MAQAANGVLVVDGEPITWRAVAESLEQWAEAPTVEWAAHGREALARLRRAQYSVLLTEYHLPDMGGLQLAETVRRVSPGTRVVVMATQPLAALPRLVRDMGLDGYIEKPFTIGQIREVLQAAMPVPSESTQAQLADPASGPEHDTPIAVPGRPLAQTASQQDAGLPSDDAADPSDQPAEEPDLGVGLPGGGTALGALEGRLSDPSDVRPLLEELLALSHARCVVLLTMAGYPVDAVGRTHGLRLAVLGSLIAATFAATAELSRQLGNREEFESSHHDGGRHSVFAYRVGRDHLLAVVFGRTTIPGAVRLFGRRTAAALAPLLADHGKLFKGHAGLVEEVDAALDDLMQ